MKKFLTCVALAAMLASCTGGPRQLRARDLPPAANPSQVIATEIAFARAAQEKGQWTAFRQYAANDAMLFVPQPVNAQDWLRRQADPARAVTWQPLHVWSSCDGEYAITMGTSQNAGRDGWFSTVWKRQEDREYKWVLDQGGDGDPPVAATEFIDAKVGSCDNRQGITPPALPVPADGTQLLYGEASDKTLRWITRVEPDGSRYYAVEYWTGETFERPIAVNVPAPGN